MPAPQRAPAAAETAAPAAAADALRIWSRQIENAREQTETAVVELSRAFSGVVRQIDATVDESRSVSEKRSRAVSADLDEARAALSAVLDELRAAQELRRQVDAELAGLLAHTHALMAMTDEIGSIAMQTTILSLNAAIEAAHAGSAGTGFAIVAEEVRNLAHASSTTSNKINERIRLVNNALQNFAERSKEVGSDDEEVLRHADTNIQLVLQRQQERMEQVASTDLRSREQATKVRSLVEDALLHLQFQDRVSQILAQISAAMADVESLDKLSVESIAEGYTTDEQRRLHAGEQAQAAAPQDVTFF